jgi:hypothetical protein
VAFKVPSDEVDRSPDSPFFSHWDPLTKTFTLQLPFRSKADAAAGAAAKLATGAGGHRPQLQHDVRR